MVIGALAAAMMAQINGKQPKAQICGCGWITDWEAEIETYWGIRIAARSEAATKPWDPQREDGKDLQRERESEMKAMS